MHHQRFHVRTQTNRFATERKKNQLVHIIIRISLARIEANYALATRAPWFLSLFRLKRLTQHDSVFPRNHYVSLRRSVVSLPGTQSRDTHTHGEERFSSGLGACRSTARFFSNRLVSWSIIISLHRVNATLFSLLSLLLCTGRLGKSNNKHAANSLPMRSNERRTPSEAFKTCPRARIVVVALASCRTAAGIQITVETMHKCEGMGDCTRSGRFSCHSYDSSNMWLGRCSWSVPAIFHEVMKAKKCRPVVQCISIQPHSF